MGLNRLLILLAFFTNRQRIREINKIVALQEALLRF